MEVWLSPCSTLKFTALWNAGHVSVMKDFNTFHVKRKSLKVFVKWGSWAEGLTRECSGVSKRLSVYPLALKTMWPQRQAVSGCGPVMMCSQSPQCPDGCEHTSSQPHTPRLPTSCRSPALWSCSSTRTPLLNSSRLSEQNTTITTTMARCVCSLVVLVLVGLLVALVHTGKRCLGARQPRCPHTAEQLVCLL